MNRIDQLTADTLRYLDEREAAIKRLAEATDASYMREILGSTYNPGLPCFDQSGNGGIHPDEEDR